MSLILEALRKSEAERRRGDAPDLRVELPPPAPPKRRIAPLARIAGGLLLGAIAFAALWLRDAAGDASGGDHPATTPAGLPASASTPRDAVAGDAGQDRPEGGFPAVERIQAPDAAPAPGPAPDLPLAPPPMATRAAEEAAAAAEGAGPVEPAIAAHVAAAPAPTAGADGAGRGALRIAGLTSSQRERLPDLKLSLHMWNEDPARRFAVIDGQRRIEGDRLGDATIIAIDRDGILLDLDGQAVRVPLP